MKSPKKMNRIFQYIIFITLLLFGHCSKNNDPIVAKFGTNTITLTEFRTGYLQVMKQANKFDSKQMREKYLNEMIQRRLLAEEAEKLGLNEDEKLNYRINAYHNKCLREAHYDKRIKPKIKISEKEIQKVYRFTQEKRRVQHLFVKLKTQADSLYQLLQEGVPFKKLASAIFRDEKPAKSGGDLGWVVWDQLDYDLAMTAFRLPVNSYSKPVKSRYGYHILKVTDFQKKPLLTRQEYELHRNKTKYLLEYKIGDKIAAEYIQQMMADKKVKIYPKLVKFVGKKISESLQRKPTQFDQMFERQLRDEEADKIQTGLWNVRHETLATIDSEAFSVGEFISSLQYVPYDVIYQNYKKALDFAIRDFALTKEAHKLGLDKDPQVATKTHLFKEYLLQLKFKRKLVREVTVTEDEIKAYYSRKKDKKFQKVEYETVKEMIRKQLEQEKRRNVVAEFIAQIEKKLTIRKNPELIHRFYDTVEKSTGAAGSLGGKQAKFDNR